MQAARRATAASTPITIPAIAPPDMEGAEAGASEGCWFEAAVDAPDEVVVAADEDVDREVDDEVVGLCVAAIRASGSKVRLAEEGLAAARDEYVFCSTGRDMLSNVLCAELQQMLIWPGDCVHCSLPSREGQYGPSTTAPESRWGPTESTSGQGIPNLLIDTAPYVLAATAI